jgi:hypothetical protein
VREDLERGASMHCVLRRRSLVFENAAELQHWGSRGAFAKACDVSESRRCRADY